jgi:hypothetical protein
MGNMELPLPESWPPSPQETAYALALEQRANARIEANARLLDPLPSEGSIDPEKVSKWERKARNLALKVNAHVGIQSIEAEPQI